MTTKRTATRKPARKGSHHTAAERVRHTKTSAVTLPVVGRVRMPRREELAYYGVLAGLAALELIDWPIALVVGVGHAMASNRHNQIVEEIGEALEEA